MERNDEVHSYKPKLSKEGLHVNGWVVPWPVILLIGAFVYHAIVVQTQVGHDRRTVIQLDRQLDEEAERIRKLENRMSSLETRVDVRDSYDPMQRPGL